MEKSEARSAATQFAPGSTDRQWNTFQARTAQAGPSVNLRSQSLLSTRLWVLLGSGAGKAGPRQSSLRTRAGRLSAEECGQRLGGSGWLLDLTRRTWGQVTAESAGNVSGSFRSWDRPYGVLGLRSGLNAHQPSPGLSPEGFHVHICGDSCFHSSSNSDLGNSTLFFPSVASIVSEVITYHLEAHSSQEL